MPSSFHQQTTPADNYQKNSALDKPQKNSSISQKNLQKVKSQTKFGGDKKTSLSLCGQNKPAKILTINPKYHVHKYNRTLRKTPQTTPGTR